MNLRLASMGVLGLGLSSAAEAAPVVRSGLAGFSSTSLALKYRAFRTTTAKELFFGFDPLATLSTSGTYTSRLDQDITWSTSQTVTVTYNPVTDELRSTVVVGATTYTKTYTKVSITAPLFASSGGVGDLDAMELSMAARDALTSVRLTGVVIDGQSVGDFEMVNSLVPGVVNTKTWTITNLNFADGFTLQATLALSGTPTFSAENNHIQFRLGDLANPDSDADGDPDSTDCDPSDPTIYNGADEFCDGVDEDCDGAIDNAPLDGLSYFPDLDLDGYGDEVAETTSCEPMAGLTTVGGDCDDNDPYTSPGEDEFCVDSVDNDCDGEVDQGCDMSMVTVPALFSAKGRRWIDEEPGVPGTQIITFAEQGYAGVADRIAMTTLSYVYTSTGLTGAPFVIGRTSGSTHGYFVDTLVACGRPFVVGTATATGADAAWTPTWNAGLTKTLKIIDRTTDTDGDGVTDAREMMVNCTDPASASSY
jgi:hypothetical protein